MSRLFLFRLALDFLAVSLLLAAYAYNWLGNAAHEVIGTALFALLVSHNIFNRRWYGTLTKRRREARSSISKAINLSLLAAMLSLLITSVIISQTVFSFLSVGTSFTARQAHTVAAYGALLIVALHLGLQWSMIMGLVQRKLAIQTGNRHYVWVLRALALCIAAYGAHSLHVVDVVSKLSMQMPTGFSIFQISTPALLLHHLAIVGLGICVVHGALRATQAMAGKSTSA